MDYYSFHKQQYKLLNVDTEHRALNAWRQIFTDLGIVQLASTT